MTEIDFFPININRRCSINRLLGQTGGTNDQITRFSEVSIRIFRKDLCTR
jgi:hypothetical protein